MIWFVVMSILSIETVLSDLVPTAPCVCQYLAVSDFAKRGWPHRNNCSHRYIGIYPYTLYGSHEYRMHSEWCHCSHMTISESHDYFQEHHSQFFRYEKFLLEINFLKFGLLIYTHCTVMPSNNQAIIVWKLYWRLYGYNKE